VEVVVVDEVVVVVVKVVMVVVVDVIVVVVEVVVVVVAIMTLLFLVSSKFPTESLLLNRIKVVLILLTGKDER
jgi:hypothetical protein